MVMTDSLVAVLSVCILGSITGMMLPALMKRGTLSKGTSTVIDLIMIEIIIMNKLHRSSNSLTLLHHNIHQIQFWIFHHFHHTGKTTANWISNMLLSTILLYPLLWSWTRHQATWIQSQSYTLAGRRPTLSLLYPLQELPGTCHQTWTAHTQKKIFEHWWTH